MGKLHKANGQESDGFFSMPNKSFRDHVPQMKKDMPKKAEKDRSWATQKPASRMDNNSAIDSRGSKFLSAGMGQVSDDRGPRKHIGSHNQNSMWDSGVIDRLAKQQGNDEKTSAERESIEKTRNGFKQERMDALVEGIREADTRKDSGVTSMGGVDGSGSRKSYRMPSQNISIFDDNSNFSRIPEKSKGDKIRESARKPKERDDSWKKVSGTTNTKSLMDSLFDKLTSKREEK